MRFGWVLAAMAALWAMPAQAVVDLKNGVFTGTITSGTANVGGGTLIDSGIYDLTGLAIEFTIDTDAASDPMFGTFKTSFFIPNAPHFLLRGYPVENPAPAYVSVSQIGNDLHLSAGGLAPSNNTIYLELSGPIADAQTLIVNSLVGSIKGIQYGLGSDYFSVDYNLNVDLTGSAWARGAAVPEPATWALMIIGIGFAGAAMRRRRYEIVTVLLGTQTPSP